MTFVFLLASSNLRAQESYQVDAKASKLIWKGYHLAKSYEHSGNISVRSGTIAMSGGDLVSADIVIDMESITNTDLTDLKDNSKLVKDLKSKRFFYADEYPEARLLITKVTKKGKEYQVNADITIRGITKQIVFNATKLSENSGSVTFSAELEIDRTEHKVMYGWTIENAVLSNNFDLSVKIVASKSLN